MTTPDWLERTSLLMGPDKMERFRRAHVLVVGTGGVGAYAAEMLVRAGIGRLTLLDADRVQPSNINRQLCALHSTVGEEKVRVLGLRFKDINPELDLTVRAEFLEEHSASALLDSAKFDFIVDAIDTIAPKCALIEEAMKRRIRIVSSMGAGAKTDITQIRFCRLVGNVSLRAEQSRADPAEKRRVCVVRYRWCFAPSRPTRPLWYRLRENGIRRPQRAR